MTPAYTIVSGLFSLMCCRLPGRLAMWGDYAVVSTAVAGIQIVNIKQAIENQTNGQPSDGLSIAGVLDTMGQGYGSPNDLAIFNERSAVFTTNPGYLLTVDLNLPTDPTSIADMRSALVPASGINYLTLMMAVASLPGGKDLPICPLVSTTLISIQAVRMCWVVIQGNPFNLSVS